MGNCRSVMSHPQLISDEEIDQLAKSTGFTHKQILRLHLRFMALDKGGKGVLDRDDFFNIPDLEMNPLGDRIIDAFFAEASDPEKRLTFPEFVAVLAHFRPCSDHAYTHEHSANDHHTHDALTNNSREEKLKFAFSMYDLNKNGFITKCEFKVILNMMVGSNITTEQLNSITDRTITEGDFEHNGKISFQEFCRAMESINIEELMSIRFGD